MPSFLVRKRSSLRKNSRDRKKIKLLSRNCWWEMKCVHPWRKPVWRVFEKLKMKLLLLDKSLMGYVRRKRNGYIRVPSTLPCSFSLAHNS
ncbi:rCG51162 [Rattus norvegicus]|uniref:RCG51162 n=1 Tax=Rattus norvegicus TaxID=10116 RepID=A6IZ07_RAT|nr:rCG51162 [Rattus norvegicus]